jgi:acetyl-CoA carboxylase biotin carboxyl carrier protein
MKSRKTPRKSIPAAAAARPAPPPSPRAPTYDDILAIAKLVESGSRFTEFRLRSGDIEVEVKRANGVAPAAPAPSPVPAAAPSAPVAPAAPAVSRAALPDLPAGTVVITAPMVGTFYRAPEPGAAPFVEVGAKVRPDTIVCLIEVMKLMNSVPAGIEGTVTHVFAENAQMVELGQALLAIRPR